MFVYHSFPGMLEVVEKHVYVNLLVFMAMWFRLSEMG